jgi:acyl-coenzyme A synthetase/AMP-(fatty) acid ligase
LGEIEAALNALKELKECAVVAVPTDGFETNLICCAYVAQENVRTSHAEIRSRIGAVLPSYMLPARWMDFVQLPKNANGKIDRRKIQELFATQDAEKLVLKQADPDGCCVTATPGNTDLTSSRIGLK